MKTNNSWHAQDTGSGQSLIIDEITGESIAVSYKSENAPLLASAPEAVELLQEALDLLSGMITKDFENGGDQAIRTKIENFLYDLHSV